MAAAYLHNETLVHVEPEFIKGLKGPVVCSTRAHSISRGFFFNENPLRDDTNVFTLQIILLVLACHLIYLVLRPLKQTKFVCSVLAGILIGPHMLGGIPIFGKSGLFPGKDMVLLSTMGSLGICFFIFLAAVKMDVTMIQRTAKSASLVGSLCVLVPFAATSIATMILPMTGMRKDMQGFFRFLFSSGLSVTRFANVADAFDELDLLTSQQSQLVLSSSMISEIFTWMSLIIGIIYRNVKTIPMIPVWLFLTVIGAVFFAMGLRAAARKIIAKLNEEGVVQVDEILVTSILVVALMLGFVTDLIGSIHLGVLILGLVMPEGPPLGSAIVERAEYMVKEFFMPVFYILVGYLTDISSVKQGNFMEIIVFIVVSFAAKFLATVGGALACRHDLPNAVLLGFMVNVKGPMDQYLLMRWKGRKDVDDAAHAILVLSQVVITAVMMPLIQKLHASCQKHSLTDRKSIRAIQTTSNNNEFKILCCVHSMDNIPGLISVLEASNGSSSSKVSAVVVHLNDLVGRAAPLVVRNDKEERKVDTNKSDAVAHEFESYARRSEDPMAVTNFIVVAPYRTMHENICYLAQKEKTTLVILPYRKVQSDAPEALVAQATATRNLNCRMLWCNPCAVGMFVNKGFGKCLSYDSFACVVHVAVIFAGGNDDREALAYGARMLMHPMVRVSLLRLIVRSPPEYVEDMYEKKLDDAMVEEFRIRGMEDPRANYFEEAAIDPLGTLNAIRALGDHYNLILTGRESSLMMSVFNEMLDASSWGENPELGIVGDFVASDDYNEGKTSALIMHRYPSRTISALNKRRPGDYEDEFLLGRLV